MKNIEILEHQFIKGVTYGGDNDFTDLKCKICGYEVTLDNFDNEVKDYNTSDKDLDDFVNSDNRGNAFYIRISCKEYQIKSLLE